MFPDSERPGYFLLRCFMGTEIERKFLVVGDEWREGAVGVDCRQGYLAVDHARSVRVRVMGDKGFITIKGATHGISRAEFEYEIPAGDAREILDTMCAESQVIKTRYLVKYGGFTWEVDVFAGDNQGLIVAEIELTSEDQKFELPPWIGEEVSHDHRYGNLNLSRNPYCRWK